MTYAKTLAFEERLQLLAQYAKLLSHPARLQVVDLLAEKQSCISGDIAAELPLSRTTVSQHLAELKAAGLITGEIDGVRVCYCLNVSLLREMQSAWAEFFDKAVSACDCAPKTDCDC